MPKEFSASQLIKHVEVNLLAMEAALEASLPENTTYRKQLDAIKALLQQAKEKLQQHPQQMLERTTKGELSHQSVISASRLFGAGIIDDTRYSQMVLLNHRVFADMLASFLEHMRTLHLTFNQESMLSLLSADCSTFISKCFNTPEENTDQLLQLADNIDLEQITQCRNELSRSYQIWINLLREVGVSESLTNNYMYCVQYDAISTTANVVVEVQAVTMPITSLSNAPEVTPPEATVYLPTVATPLASTTAIGTSTGTREVINADTGEIVGTAQPASGTVHYTDPATIHNNNHSEGGCLVRATPPNSRVPQPAATIVLLTINDGAEEVLDLDDLNHNACCIIS